MVAVPPSEIVSGKGMFDPPPGCVCANCNKRPATKAWTGDGGVMDLVHGNFAFWCEFCILTAQIEHAKKRAACIPKLEADLRSLNDPESPAADPPNENLPIPQRKLIQLIAFKDRPADTTHTFLGLSDDGILWERNSGRWIKYLVNDDLLTDEEKARKKAQQGTG